ncbi:MAG: hypothetical protein Q7K65_00105 [Candidatus Buchananbacteria bacterium]|nr:hypothetical protein [Candidatus Buchananbacteria bacterium]
MPCLNKNQNGQSLLELVVAIGVITVGLFSVWNLFISNFNGEQESGARVLAINLAREGVEIVKNIRDSNWLYIDNNDNCSYNGIDYDPCNWDSGLSGDGTGVAQNIFSDSVYIDYANVDNISDDKAKIYQDPTSGLYSHDNLGQPTIYRRFIEIKNICCADVNSDLKCDDLSVDFTVKDTVCLESELKVGLDVKSTVSWSINGQNRQTFVNERFFNWK